MRTNYYLNTWYKLRRYFFITLFTATIFSCSSGGGDGSDSNSDIAPSSSNTVTSATTFDEYLSQLQTYNDRGLNSISASKISSFFAYDSLLIDFQNDTVANGLSNPMEGIYHNFVQPGQGFTDIWPSSPNAEFSLIPVNPSYSRITARDLTNGQTIDGDFKFFFGAKQTEFSKL